ncbi:MAG: hypothetical protein ACIAQZ_16965 [Sedimentisphaeraceae bacterium JB056]
MEKHLILGVHITNRLIHAGEIQDILTKFGGIIRTRLGLHEVETGSSPNGVLLLECTGDETKFHDLAEALSGVEGVEIKKMVFDHP